MDLMTSIVLAACAAPRPGQVAKPCKDHESIVVGGSSAPLEVVALVLIAVLIWTVVITRLRHARE